MSQQELSEMLFVDRAIVSKIENGHIMPDEELVNRWIGICYENFKQMQREAILYNVMMEAAQRAQVSA